MVNNGEMVLHSFWEWNKLFTFAPSLRILFQRSACHGTVSCCVSSNLWRVLVKFPSVFSSFRPTFPSSFLSLSFMMKHPPYPFLGSFPLLNPPLKLCCLCRLIRYFLSNTWMSIHWEEAIHQSPIFSLFIYSLDIGLVFHFLFPLRVNAWLLTLHWRAMAEPNLSWEPFQTHFFIAYRCVGFSLCDCLSDKGCVSV